MTLGGSRPHRWIGIHDHDLPGHPAGLPADPAGHRHRPVAAPRSCRPSARPSRRRSSPPWRSARGLRLTFYELWNSRCNSKLPGLEQTNTLPRGAAAAGLPRRGVRCTKLIKNPRRASTGCANYHNCVLTDIDEGRAGQHRHHGSAEDHPPCSTPRPPSSPRSTRMSMPIRRQAGALASSTTSCFAPRPQLPRPAQGLAGLVQQHGSADHRRSARHRTASRRPTPRAPASDDAMSALTETTASSRPP